MDNANVAAIDGLQDAPKPMVHDDFAYSVASAFAIGCWAFLLVLI